MDLVKIVSKWSDINSGSYNVAGLNVFATELEKHFGILGGVGRQHPLPKQKSFDARGIPIQKELGKALIFQKRKKAPVQILLVGHMDTVFHATHPFQKVKRLDHNRLQGPGVADMKGGLLVLLKSLEKFEKCAEAQRIGWKVVINPDEEIGSPGSKKLLLENAKKCDVGLVFEPTLEDGSFVSARGGSANYMIVAKGISAHVGRSFSQGKNAIVSLAKFICELEVRQKECIVNVGEIKGGHAPNCVPDFAWCTLTVRSSKTSALEKIDAWLKSQAPNISTHQMSLRPPKPCDPKTKELFDILKKCGKKVGVEVALQETRGVCDGNFLASVGLPTIDTLGVRGGWLHSSKEFLWIDSIKERIELTVELLKTLALRGQCKN